MESIFSKGADLWVIPDIENSQWRWTLEWSVNFQIARSLRHSPLTVSDTVKKTLMEWEADEFLETSSSTLSNSSPWLMISVDHLLPAKWLVYSREIDPTVLPVELDRLWHGLGRPSTRFFPSKSWTSAALKKLKSECARAQTSEVMSAKES